MKGGYMPEWENHPWVVSDNGESLNAPGKGKGDTLFCSSLISNLFSISCYSISIRYGLNYMLSSTLRTTVQSSAPLEHKEAKAGGREASRSCGKAEASFRFASCAPWSMTSLSGSLH